MDSSVQASLRTMAECRVSASESETSVMGMPAERAHHTNVMTRMALFTTRDCSEYPIESGRLPGPVWTNYPAARSWAALNSQLIREISAIRYIQTSSAIPAPIEPYITL